MKIKFIYGFVLEAMGNVGYAARRINYVFEYMISSNQLYLVSMAIYALNYHIPKTVLNLHTFPLLVIKITEETESIRSFDVTWRYDAIDYMSRVPDLHLPFHAV